MRSVPKPLLIALLVALAIAAFVFGRAWFPSFEWLAERQSALQGLVEAHPVLAPLAYVLLYAALVLGSVPGGTVMSVAGGVLFGTVLGTICAVLGATLGAGLLFLLVQRLLSDWAARQAGPLLDRIKPGLERDGFNGLLALRLLPILPFWLINLAAPLAGMRLGPFLLATGLGIAPATAVFASIGAGVGGALAAGQTPGLSTVLQPSVLLPLLGLAALALAPVAWRHWRTRHG